MEINLVSRGDGNARYAINMIKLALDTVGTEYDLKISDGTLTSARQQQDTEEGVMDIMWAATTDDIEQRLLPIRIPLYKGLLGHRVFIIHKENRNLFADVSEFDQLKNFVFGQGKGWPDTDIMRHNGLEVETGTYEGLFLMADGQRFHAFPRGVNEPWGEIEQRPQLDLTVDQNLMFVYRMPFYLFVSPKRPEVAQAIENGLMQAINNGAFDALMMQDPMVQMVIARGNMSERTVFELDNPSLPAATPVDNTDLWFDIESLTKPSEEVDETIASDPL
ncbi:diguanylate cyclase [Gilvimarinus sp. SDUM040013]|uniref:Diguanylate cyclase n=1 Tax=Gilvimarinus gilvus TaxID=3058038 RepID=A0ABU4RXF2_9GAMM|nr:diguanylate cyclase [Gilvimarinus sp. SDUM040013]MDO3388674.1 diguanylate cyclase [Gilvimarinus sp. SDUM040013]MDX6849569.1 diguanylate cyclase [Gilvimarinus sp. SDUM040013]